MKTTDLLFRTNNSTAPLILRLLMAAVMFPHGAMKLLGWFGGPGYEASMHGFTQGMHIPAVFAFLDIVTEFFAPILLLLGLFSRVAAFGIGVIMVVAMALVHAQNGLFMNWMGHQKGEGIEYHLLMVAIVLAVIIQGGGKWALDSVVHHRLTKQTGEDSSPLDREPAPSQA